MEAMYSDQDRCPKGGNGYYREYLSSGTAVDLSIVVLMRFIEYLFQWNIEIIVDLREI